LVLVAEVFRGRHLAGQRRVNGNYPRGDQLPRLLTEMGFFQLIDVTDPVAEKQASGDIEHIKFFTSSHVDAPLAKQLRLALTRGINAIRVEAQHRMYEGLKEAMNNAIQHAYLKVAPWRYPVMRDRWWMAGAIDRKRNELMMMFFDQGVGIPSTLPRRHNAAYKAAKAILGIDDTPSSRIKIATRLGESTTRLSFRGKGLNDVRQFVTLCREGELRILSGRGEYVYNADGTEQLIDRSRSIGGTLIQWRVAQSSIEAPVDGANNKSSD